MPSRASTARARGAGAGAETLALAARLGAETATIPGSDVAQALVDFARERNASHLGAGAYRGTASRWMPWRPISLPEQIAQRNPNLDVLLLSTAHSKNERLERSSCARAAVFIHILYWRHAGLLCCHWRGRAAAQGV